MTIPEIQVEVLHPVINEMCVPGWSDEIWERIKVEQPVLSEYISVQHTKLSREAILSLLVLFRIIEAQLEVTALEDLYNL